MILTSGDFETTDEWTNVSMKSGDGNADPVIITSISTFNGSDTAGVRLRNVKANGFDAFIEEETSKDTETKHTQEAIQFIGISPGTIKDQSGNVIGEADFVELKQDDSEQWHTIDLKQSYNNPVIFTQVMSYKGPQACHGRIRNVGRNNFEFKIEEWSKYDGKHVKEEIGYIVIEQGKHKLENGSPIEVKKISTNHNWEEVNFGSELGKKPVVVSRCQTQNGKHEVVTRHKNLHSKKIDVRLQEHESRDGKHKQESIGILAIPRRDITIGIGRVENLTHLWKEIEFDSRMDSPPVVLSSIESWNGPDTADIRLRNVSETGVEAFVEEEASKDDEMKHTEESVGFLVFPRGTILDEEGNKIGESGVLDTDQPGRSKWHSLNFKNNYSDPVVFMRVTTYNGEHPCHMRIRNVKSEKCEFQIEEWNYLDGKHTMETIGYAVMEKGEHNLPDGTRLQVGTVNSTHNWGDEVDFGTDFKNKQPVLVSQCQTYNGHNEVVTRTRNLDSHGFQVRLQEEQGRDGEHFSETVGFIAAARPGLNVPRYQAAETPDIQVGNFEPKTCGFKFSNSGFTGSYTLPNKISVGPITIDEIGDSTNGMCGGMVYAACDYFEFGHSPWSDELLRNKPSNSPVSNNPPAEDSKLFDYLSERLFDSFKPGSNNNLGAALYQTLMNSANTKKWSQVKKSRNQVMKENWLNKIKPALDNGSLCPLGLIHVDTHGKPFKTGLKKLGKNHQVLAYGYTKQGRTIEINVYDPNYANDNSKRIQFTLKDDLGNWFEPKINTGRPLYAFFAVSYSPKQPPTF